MITIIHGDDTASSRKFYIDLKTKSKSAQTFEGEKLDFATLFQTLEGNTLFSNSLDLFIEKFFSAKKSNSLDFKQITDYLSKQKDASIVFWDDKELTKTQTASIKNANVKAFSYPSILFQFLDSIYPGNTRSIGLYHDLLNQMEPEIIFYMLTRQFRLLVATDEVGSNIDEYKRLAPWQASKLKRQKIRFDKDKLLKDYNKLYKIDYQTKFGLSPFNLSKAIDIFLLDL